MTLGDLHSGEWFANIRTPSGGWVSFRRNTQVRGQSSWPWRIFQVESWMSLKSNPKVSLEFLSNGRPKGQQKLSYTRGPIFGEPLFRARLFGENQKDTNISVGCLWSWTPFLAKFKGEPKGNPPIFGGPRTHTHTHTSRN